MTTLSDDEKKATRSDFDTVVNMTATQIETWLKTDESKAVGQKDDDSNESVGHRSGEKIVRILQKKNDDLTADDYAHMRKVVGYVKRHSAQRPDHVTGSDWAYSLKNWGHDPEKK